MTIHALFDEIDKLVDKTQITLNSLKKIAPSSDTKCALIETYQKSIDYLEKAKEVIEEFANDYDN